MAKKIDVAGHIKRYEDTDLTFIAALIEGLTNLVEQRKQQQIEFHKQQLEILETGKIPEPVIEPEKPKRTRGGKAIAQSSESA